MSERSTWAEISGRSLVSNFAKLRETAAPDEVLAVVKANAYGHGVGLCAPLLAEAGARWLGVTSVDEAISVRALCPEAQLLVMSGVWRGEGEACIAQRLAPQIWEPFHVEELARAAARTGAAPGTVPVHLEIDTGMARQGVRGRQALVEILGLMMAAPALRIEAVMTHFSSPDETGSEETGAQITRFSEALEVVLKHGHSPDWLHAGNSATLLSGLGTGLGTGRLRLLAGRAGARLMLRPGLALYGYPVRFSPGGVLQPDLEPVLSWKARIASLRVLEAGDTAGYNTTFRAARRTRLALLRVGYADGLDRLLSNRGQVLVRGQRAPVAGRISMDQTTIDVTDIAEVEIGDEAVLIGQQNGERITAYDLADLGGTIPYEILCGIAARVPRISVG